MRWTKVFPVRVSYCEIVLESHHVVTVAKIILELWELFYIQWSCLADDANKVVRECSVIFLRQAPFLLELSVNVLTHGGIGAIGAYKQISFKG